MTPDQESELEEFIDLCCREAVAEGMQICRGTTYSVEDGLCCPLGAATRATGSAIELTLRRSPYWVGAFMEGFDGIPCRSGLHPGFRMGQRFRERLEAGEYDR